MACPSRWLLASAPPQPSPGLPPGSQACACLGAFAPASPSARTTSAAGFTGQCLLTTPGARSHHPCRGCPLLPLSHHPIALSRLACPVSPPWTTPP